MDDEAPDCARFGPVFLAVAPVAQDAVNELTHRVTAGERDPNCCAPSLLEVQTQLEALVAQTRADALDEAEKAVSVVRVNCGPYEVRQNAVEAVRVLRGEG